MTRGFARRAAIAAALAAVLALSGCRSEIYQGLSESQANTMMTLLLKHGIQSEKKSAKGGFVLSVDNDRIVQALELFRENNLPKPDFENLGKVFSAKGMISSATEEQARMAYALSQELANTFSNIDGVLSARVHVVLATQDIGTGKSTPASAAVFLRHLPDSQAPHLVSHIRELTSNAVPGLSTDHVSVMLVPVREDTTVPMPVQAPAAASQAAKPLVAGAAILFILSLLGFASAAVLFARSRKAPAKDSDAPQTKA